MRPLLPLLLAVLLPFLSTGQQSIIKTIAGNGLAGYTGNGGQAWMAQIHHPEKTEVDSAGNMYFIQGAAIVRKVNAAGIISTFTGGGNDYNGEGIPAADAAYLALRDIAIDKQGNMFLAVKGKIRKIDAQTGMVTTICGDGTDAETGDGGPASTAQIKGPQALTVDKDGHIYVGTFKRIRRIDAGTNIITTVCGDGTTPTTGGNGNINMIGTYAKIQTPTAMLADPLGNIYIANNNTFIGRLDVDAYLYKIMGTNATGYTGDGGPANAAVGTPVDLALDKDGNLYFTEYSGHVRKINTQGIISTVAGKPVGYMPGYSGDGGDALDAEMNEPKGIAVDSCGNLYIADYNNNRIRKVTFDNCGELSVRGVERESGVVTVWPNPSSSFVTVSSGDKISSVSIIDVTGRVILQRTVNSGQVTVNVSGLSSGVYLVRWFDSAHHDSGVVKFVRE